MTDAWSSVSAFSASFNALIASVLPRFTGIWPVLLATAFTTGMRKTLSFAVNVGHRRPAT